MMTNLLREVQQSTLGLPSGAYIYSLSSFGDDALAAISSDNSLRCFNRRTLQLLPDGVINPIHAGKDDASGATCLCPVRSPDEKSPLLATSGRDGTVKIWDVRTGKAGAVSEFSTDTGSHPPLTALTFDPRSQSLVAGTELVSYQASVVFWDIRSPSQPRLQYVDSHNDDVTEVQFHPTRENVLLSGSTDGLVNVYNTTITDEDDALLQVVKHSSIHHAGFLSEDTVHALSHDELFSIHPLTNPDDSNNDNPAAAAVHFGDLRPILECEYVAQVLSTPSGNYIAAGNTSCQSFDLAPIASEPGFKFHFDQSNTWRLAGAHGEEIIRSVCLDDSSRTVFTCGEDGFVRVWKEEENEATKHRESQAAPVLHNDRQESAPQPRHRKDKKHKKEKKKFKPY